MFEKEQNAWLIDDTGMVPACEVTIVDLKQERTSASPWKYQLRRKDSENLLAGGYWYNEDRLRLRKPAL